MKKFLLIGAMLIVGATSFSEVLVKLTESGKGTAESPYKYSGEGVMEVGARGSILDPAGKILLVVQPSVSTGADHTALAFDFGRLTRNDTRIRQSEFIAQVLKDGEPMPIVNSGGTSAISATIENGELQDLFNEKNEKIGSIKYTLGEMSGLSGDKLTYTGRVKAEIATGRGKDGQQISSGSTPTGSFTHNTSSIKVSVTSVVKGS